VGGLPYPWKICLGEGLFLLVMLRGGRYWSYRHRYGGKQNPLSPVLIRSFRLGARGCAIESGASCSLSSDPAPRRKELKRCLLAEPTSGVGSREEPNRPTERTAEERGAS
jgi:hypothetical protein